MVDLGPERPFFDLQPGEDKINDPLWPEQVKSPSKEEVRQLVHQDLLQVDQTAAPVWRVWPSKKARDIFQDQTAEDRSDALADPDRRLAVILDATVSAFSKDPSTPLLLVRADQADIVRHPHWGMEADVVRKHDLLQLEELGLIGWDGETMFFPTARGRQAATDPAAFLAQTAESIEDEEERSRLRRLAEQIRAGDVAVGTATSLTSFAIRAVLGLG